MEVCLGGISMYIVSKMYSLSFLEKGLRKAMSFKTNGTSTQAFGPVYFIERCPRFVVDLGKT